MLFNVKKLHGQASEERKGMLGKYCPIQEASVLCQDVAKRISTLTSSVYTGTEM